MSLSDWLVFVKERKAFFVQDAHIREVVKKLKGVIAYEFEDSVDEKVSVETKAVLRVLDFKINEIFGDKLIKGKIPKQKCSRCKRGFIGTAFNFNYTGEDNIICVECRKEVKKNYPDLIKKYCEVVTGK